MTTRKSAASAAPKKSVAKSPAKAEPKKAKQKVKIVRDSFTMPEAEYRKIAEIKEVAQKAGLQVKKSEVLRAGLQVLCGLGAAQLKRVLTGVEKVKTGRPKKQ
jgi:hypothetical protein